MSDQTPLKPIEEQVEVTDIWVFVTTQAKFLETKDPRYRLISHKTADDGHTLIGRFGTAAKEVAEALQYGTPIPVSDVSYFIQAYNIFKNLLNNRDKKNKTKPSKK